MNELSYFSVSRRGDRSKSREEDILDLSHNISDLQREFESKQTFKKSSKTTSKKITPSNPYSDPHLKNKKINIGGLQPKVTSEI